MTLAEYMDPNRFPVTTQVGLSPKGQLMIDAVNYDALREYVEEGGALSDEQEKRLAELQEKLKDHARLTRELAAEEKAKGGK
jgi:hypothetical protein